MNVITTDHLTKDYGQGKGVFDITLAIPSGTVYGYLGPNGAGKSTTMRHLMGFSRPQSGSAKIAGLDCWRRQRDIQPIIGYLPGEIAFPDDMTGRAYLRLIARMRKIKDFSRAEALLETFALNPDAPIKRMSKGMKQKLGIVCAFMHDPEILLLDEPTSGLDPLMQNRFVQFIREEKTRGKTILLSSHIFEEVEKTCDRIGMIRAGRLIKEISIDALRHAQRKTYTLSFGDAESLARAQAAYTDATADSDALKLTLSIPDREWNRLIACLANCNVIGVHEEAHTLEDYFMQFYGEERTSHE